MPIYEFYCDICNVIFNFYSARINTKKIPACPKCGKNELEKQLSTFATTGKARDRDEDMLGGVDETQMEHAFESLMRDAEQMNEDDPKQMASLMRKFTSQTGVHLGETMEEAISRMEAGDDPELIEQEMGDQLGEDDFSFDSLKRKILSKKTSPKYDETLYDL